MNVVVSGPNDRALARRFGCSNSGSGAIKASASACTSGEPYNGSRDCAIHSVAAHEFE